MDSSNAAMTSPEQQQTPSSTPSHWERRPTVIPVSVSLRRGLPQRDVQIMHPLNAGSSASEFTQKQGIELAKATQGDPSFIVSQLDSINKLFHDGDKRCMEPKLVVLTVMVPLETKTNAHSGGHYYLYHQCLWDAHSPCAFVDVYCNEIVSDVGLGSSVAHALSVEMKSRLDDIRKKKVVPKVVEAKVGSDIIVEDKKSFPVVLKVNSKEEAERMLMEFDQAS